MKESESNQSPERVKKYRSYLTRLSKWEAIRAVISNKGVNQVGEDHLRRVLVDLGEIRSFMDDRWAKRIFSDGNLFESDGDGFWRLKNPDEWKWKRGRIVRFTDEHPEGHIRKRPEWTDGVRPGEDVVGTAYEFCLDRVSNMPVPNRSDERMDSDEWVSVGQKMVRVMKWCRKRGLEKPLAPLQEHAFQKSLLTTDRSAHTVALWFTRARIYLDAFVAIRKSKEGDTLPPHADPKLWLPRSVPASISADGSYRIDEPSPSVELAKHVIHENLAKIGIVSKKSG